MKLKEDWEKTKKPFLKPKRGECREAGTSHFKTQRKEKIIAKLRLEG